MPAWVSPWGLAALMLGTAALLAASLIGERLVTLLLSAGGLTAVVLGRRATGAERTSSDGVWLALAGALSGLVLVLTIFSPGVLNNRWAIDFAVPQVDPDEQVVVPLNKPRDQGTVLTADDWVDASKDAIRQDDLLLNVESVQVGPLEDKGPGAYGAVHIRFANIGSGTINFQGFDHELAGAHRHLGKFVCFCRTAATDARQRRGGVRSAQTRRHGVVADQAPGISIGLRVSAIGTESHEDGIARLGLGAER